MHALMIDFGSTYTKTVAVDLDGEVILGTSQAPTTVKSNIMIGLNEALEKLYEKTGRMEFDYKLACSSAAGGLRMVAVGYVKELTAEASNRAALGAGAKVLDVFSYGLDDQELEELVGTNPDIILLAGGTDGGDKEILLHNAKKIAGCPLKMPVVVAGNKKAAHKAGEILRNGGKEAIITENVMPGLNVLNVEPARKAIREIFMRRVVSAKGLDKATSFVGDILMPTPMALLNAARLLAEGTKKEPGLGELVIVDVGGATTDIHSVAHGKPTTNAFLKGLPEPIAKRTVEGDLGLRYNALTIYERAGEERILKNSGLPMDYAKGLQSYLELISSTTNRVPENETEAKIDLGLARTAVEIAIGRHAGVVEEVYMPDGLVRIQTGKDLTDIKMLIGTGGVFVYGAFGFEVLAGATYNVSDPLSLRPKAPDLYLDSKYILYSIGLLAEISPEASLRIAKNALKKRL